MDCEVIGWCALKPEVQAAWVQAIGSVLAIIAAFLVPYFQRRNEVRDRKSEAALLARSLGTALLRELVKFKERIARDLQKAEGALPHSLVRIANDTIPQKLWDNSERLHLLGDAGHHALLAINATRLARKQVENHVLSPTEGKAERFKQQMIIARSECDEAISLLEAKLNQ